MRYVEYYIFFERCERPEVYRFENIQHMIDELIRLMAQRGPIDWMQRKYK